MKKLLIAFFLLSSCLSAQTRPHWLQLQGTPVVDFRTFGARATAGFDNAPALASAAAYIQAAGGNVTFVIPGGTYGVVPAGAATSEGSRVLWSAFKLTGVDNVKIVGMDGAKFTSDLDMGSATTPGKCMWLFEFVNCNNVTVENVIADINVTGTPNPAADVTETKLAAIVHATVASETISGLAIKNCDFTISNPAGNGAKLGYEFITCFIEGDWTSPYSFPYRGVTIENNVFRDGQGPEVWLWFTRGALIRNNRWTDSGGPLNPVRMYPACADVTIENNSFKHKTQPNETVGIGHNFAISSAGGSGGATDKTLAADNIVVRGNKFETLTGQAAVFAGGDGIVFTENNIYRPTTATETHNAGSVTFTTSGTAFNEPIGSAIVSDNHFFNVPVGGVFVTAPGSGIASHPRRLSVSNNTFESCVRALLTSALVRAESIDFIDNSVSGSTQESVYIAGVATVTSQINISGNSFLRNVKECLFTAFSNVHTYRVENNTFALNGLDASAAIVAARGGAYVISNNYFRGNVGAADIAGTTFITGSKGISISGNLIEGSYKNSISLSGIVFNVTGNTIINPNQSESVASAGAGISIASGSYQLAINSNTIIDEAGKATMGIYAQGTSKGIVQGNHISGPYTTAIIDLTDSTLTPFNNVHDTGTIP